MHTADTQISGPLFLAPPPTAILQECNSDEKSIIYATWAI